MRTLAHISDLHFGRHSPTVANSLLDCLSESRPDLVVVSGDLTQRARHAEFAQAQRFLSCIAPPKLVVPGNHDVPLYDLISRLATPFAKYQHYVAPLGLPAGFFCDAEMAVLGLNTARRFPGKSGRVSIEQIAQIGRTFGPVPSGVFKILVTHHPLGFPSGEAPLELAGRSSLALEAVAAAEVHLLLSGHHHRSAHGEMVAEVVGKGCVLILHAGTAISTRLRGTEGNSYNLMRIDGARVHIAVMQWEPQRGFREGRSLSYRLIKGRWRKDA